MTGEFHVFLLLYVLDNLIKIELAHFEHPCIDLDYITLITRLFHRHLHHICSFCLNPDILLSLRLSKACPFVENSSVRIPLAFLVGTPFSLVLELADSFLLAVRLFGACICVDGLHGLDT